MWNAHAIPYPYEYKHKYLFMPYYLYGIIKAVIKMDKNTERKPMIIPDED